MKKQTVVLVCGFAAIASGCSDGFHGVCTPNMVFGLQIHIVNDQSEAPICDVVVTARDGVYSETLVRSESVSAGCYYFGAAERAGTYSLRAEVAGFGPVTVSDVRVRNREDDCHVETVRRTMRLVPLAQR